MLRPQRLCREPGSQNLGNRRKYLKPHRQKTEFQASFQVTVINILLSDKPVLGMPLPRYSCNCWCRNVLHGQWTSIWSRGLKVNQDKIVTFGLNWFVGDFEAANIGTELIWGVGRWRMGFAHESMSCPKITFLLNLLVQEAKTKQLLWIK